MKLVFLPSTRSDLLWMRTYYSRIFPDGARRAVDQYGRVCNILRDNPLVGVRSRRWRVCGSSQSRERHSPSSTESLMTELKYCVAGISAVTVQGLHDRQPLPGTARKT